MCFLPVFSSESCVFLLPQLVPLVSFSPCSLCVVVKIAMLCIPRIPCCPSAYIPSCQLWQCSQQYPALLTQQFSCFQQHLSAAVSIILLMQTEAAGILHTLSLFFFFLLLSLVHHFSHTHYLVNEKIHPQQLHTSETATDTHFELMYLISWCKILIAANN